MILNNKPYLSDIPFLQALDETLNKELSVKIVLLDQQEQEIGEIHGIAMSGNLAINGTSSLRRVFTLSLLADSNYNQIADFNEILSLNKKIKLEVGQVNNIPEYSHYPDTIWFPLGVYIITELGITKGVDSSIINITAHDKMCLLNGTVSGVISAPMVLHEKGIRINETTIQYQPVSMFEIIQELVSQVGGESSGKIIINDLPWRVKKSLKYMGKDPIYFSANGNQLPSGDPAISHPLTRKLEPGGLAGYDWVLFSYPTGDLIAQPGNTVVNILDKIKEVLGNYEYFYDIEGNFVFQEIKNYLNTSFRPITQREGKDYYVNLGETPYKYDFTSDKTILSYANTPNLENIKNDFVVWGQRLSASGAKLPIRFHLAIDDIPQNTGGLPWQVYLYNIGKEARSKGLDPGYYFRELEHEMKKLYWLPDDPDNEEGKTGWKNLDGTDMDYYLDMIDSRSELGKYSVSTIGRRTVAINDKNITTIYPPNIPDYVILAKGTQETAELIPQLNAMNQKFIIVEQRDLYSYATIGRAAFDVVRDLVHQHTTYSEKVSISCLPKYYLEPNTMVKFEDEESGISGNYIITQFQIPFEIGTPSNITAVKATTRI